jgi:Ser/Thr protein kinase RdoA (MazF antagonist)
MATNEANLGPPPALDRAAREVLARYPAFLRQSPPLPLGNRGGFSGARLWRIEAGVGAFCLRAWPPHETPQRAHYRHALTARARAHGLHFVPAVLPTLDGGTAVEHAGRLWEVEEWLPGRADYHERPSRVRLEEACRALARLHGAWEGLAEPAPAPCPAVARRLECLREWRELLGTGWHPLTAADRADPLRPLAERAWRLLARRAEAVPGRLRPWAARPWRLQPCLCDLWHDHLLYEGERLTGLVDYGAVKVDHPAVDLARLLGSLVADDADGWSAGLEAYREVRPLAEDEVGLARALDETGTVLGVVNWLRWLYAERREFDDCAAAGRRLTALVERVESWAKPR